MDPVYGTLTVEKKADVYELLKYYLPKKKRPWLCKLLNLYDLVPLPSQISQAKRNRLLAVVTYLPRKDREWFCFLFHQSIPEVFHFLKHISRLSLFIIILKTEFIEFVDFVKFFRSSKCCSVSFSF